jgi:hypothetical protein
MAVTVCPDFHCKTLNNGLRTVCRKCGAALKPWAKAERQEGGRITLDMGRATSYPTLTPPKDSLSIPVLFDGEDVGIYIHLSAHHYTRDLFNQAKEALVSAFQKRRERV